MIIASEARKMALKNSKSNIDAALFIIENEIFKAVDSGKLYVDVRNDHFKKFSFVELMDIKDALIQHGL